MEEEEERVDHVVPSHSDVQLFVSHLHHVVYWALGVLDDGQRLLVVLPQLVTELDEVSPREAVEVISGVEKITSCVK